MPIKKSVGEEIFTASREQKYLREYAHIATLMGLIHDLLKEFSCLHFSLIDPENQTSKKAGEHAHVCQQYGTHAIMVGGSTVSKREKVHSTVKEIKKKVHIPVILFPNSAVAISRNADYVFFMELLNSLEYRYRGGEQLKGALLIKKWGIIPISMGYIVVSTSTKPTTLEKRTQLDAIHQQDIEKAVKYAVYAEMRGMSCVYLEAGSNAEFPVATNMVHAVSTAINIPVIVGGGIKTADIAQEKIDAGARVIVNGTATEKNMTLIKEIIGRIGHTSHSPQK